MLYKMLTGAVSGLLLGAIVVIFGMIKGAMFRNKLINSSPYRKGKEYFVYNGKRCDKEYALSKYMDEYRGVSSRDIEKSLDSCTKTFDDNLAKGHKNDLLLQIQIEALYNLANNICPEKYKCPVFIDQEINIENPSAAEGSNREPEKHPSVQATISNLDVVIEDKVCKNYGTEAINASTPDNMENEKENSEDFVFCYKCGTKQPMTNKFCHECGAKIARGDL